MKHTRPTDVVALQPEAAAQARAADLTAATTTALATPVRRYFFAPVWLFLACALLVPSNACDAVAVTTAASTSTTVSTTTALAITLAVAASPTVKASRIIRLVTTAAVEIASALVHWFSRKLGQVNADPTVPVVRWYFFAPAELVLACALIVPGNACAAIPYSIFGSQGAHRDSSRCAEPWSRTIPTARSPTVTPCAHSAAQPAPTRTCGVERHNLPPFGTTILTRP